MDIKPLDELSRDDFATLKDAVFIVKSGDLSNTQILLKEISDLREEEAYTSFALVFLAPPGTPAVSQSLQLSHDQIGIIELYLSVFSAGESGVRFEAILSRLT